MLAMFGFLVSGLAWIARRLSLGAALALGTFLGLVWFHVVRVRRRTVLEALGRAFPEWSRGRRRAVARSMYVRLARHAMEFFRAVGGASTSRVAVEGIEHYERSLVTGHGVIVATAHIGGFDLAAVNQAAAGRKLTLLSRRLSNRSLDRRWMEWRRRCGLAIVDEAAPLAEMARVLRAGGTLVLLVDQATPPDRGGIRIPFLGRPAWTTRLPAILALRTGAPIVPVFPETRPDGTHLIRVEPPVAPATGEGTVAERSERIVREIAERLEARIRANPDQWLWLHRRWKDFDVSGPTTPPPRRPPRPTPRDPPES